MVASVSVVDHEGFQRALRPIRVRVSSLEPTQTTNAFQLLHDETQPELGTTVGDGNVCDHMGGMSGRGDPSPSH